MLRPSGQQQGRAFTRSQKKVVLCTGSGFPFQTLLFSIESGGVTALPDGTLIATVVTWPAPSPPSPSPYPTPPGPCCNGTVVVYASTDQGMTWQFRAVVADKASVGTEEGPNENNIVTLKDGKTLWLIIRVDGGDGVPDHPHVPYMVTTSTDGGFTWTKLTSLPPELMSAKPKATVLSPIGALVVSGGRPALNLWVSLDGRGETWESYDIPTVHNAIVAAPSDKFCTEFENATTALGWAQSSGYTTVNAVGDDAGVVCYQRQGFGSGGYRKPIPKDCAVDFSTTFCLRFQVKSAVDQS